MRDIQLQHCLLAKTDLTLLAALDEARTAEMSTQSTADIQKALSPFATRRTIAVNHDEVDPEDVTEEEEDVNHLKAAKGKGWTTKKKPRPLQTACMDCGRNHPRTDC